MKWLAWGLDDRIALRAAALTYYTLMAMVPVLAIAFGFAQMVGFGQRLERMLMQNFPEQDQVFRQLVDFALKTVAETRGGVIAGTGAFFLLWAVVYLLLNMELAFNEIFGVFEGRSWLRRVRSYLIIMVLAPVCVIVANSVAVLIMAEVPGFLSDLAHFVPLFVNGILFTLLYLVIPFCAVPFLCALVAGGCAAVAFQVMQWIYLNFQVGLSTYGVIYGSFAAIPLFLIWLHASWLIVLYGAKIAHGLKGSN